MENQGTAILMCAGEYMPMRIPRRADHRDEKRGLPGGDKAENGTEDLFYVAVDGGLPGFIEQGIEPDLILGDFDSLEEPLRLRIEACIQQANSLEMPEILRLPAEKDDTDTLYAARVCLARGYRRIRIYGGLGGRLDHTLANIQTLAFIRRQGACGYLLGRRQQGGQEITTLITVLEEEEMILPEKFAGTFSLFAMDSRVTGVTLRGMKYPLREAVLENTFPVGVSNEVTGDTRASVCVRAGLAVVILETGQDESLADPDKMERRMKNRGLYV